MRVFGYCSERSPSVLDFNSDWPFSAFFATLNVFWLLFRCYLCWPLSVAFPCGLSLYSVATLNVFWLLRGSHPDWLFPVFDCHSKFSLHCLVVTVDALVFDSRIKASGRFPSNHLLDSQDPSLL